MASFQKRGSGWFVQVRRRGVVKCATFPTKRQAEAWATATEADILAGGGVVEVPPPPIQVTLGEVFRRYEEEVSPGKRGAKWETNRLKAMQKMPLAAMTLVDVGAPQWAQWRNDRIKEVTAGTVAREMNLLGSVLEMARKEWGLLRVNPLRDVAKPPRPRPRQRIYSDDEVRRVLLALGYDEARAVVTKQQIIAVLFQMALETGMRLGEMVGLEWYQVDVRRSVARLDITKNGDARDVPLSAVAVELFGRVRGFSRPFDVSRDVASAMFSRALRHAAIQDATFHDSRATAITRLAKKLSILDLARMVGHRELKSLQVYYRESAEEIAKRL